MRQACVFAIGISAFLLTTGCSSNEDYIADLRAAVARAEVTLVETVVVAEADASVGAAKKAALLVKGDPYYSVRTVESEQVRKYRISLRGDVMSSEDIGAGSGLCPGAVTLPQAIDAAEAQARGIAVAIEPDDDEACALEVQVLTPDTLWEVKVGSAGQILESEESDEDGTEDDD